MNTAHSLLGNVASIEVLSLGAYTDGTHFFKSTSFQTLISHASASHDERLVLYLIDAVEGLFLQVSHETKLILLETD